MKPRFNIAVTGLNAIDSPGPGVPVIRCLREAESFDCRITGLSYETLEPGIYMHDLVDKTYQIPYPSAGTEALAERLSYIHSREKLDVVIPNFDAELFSFILLEKRLLEMGIHTFLPTREQFEERHKFNLADFGDKYGLLVPDSKTLFHTGELIEAEDTFDFPFVVKGKFYDAGIAHNREQALTYFHKISGKWGLPIIIQKYIKGTEFNVAGLGDGSGNRIAAVPMRKQYITDKGKAWGGIVVEDRRLLDLTDRFTGETKWRGAFELELMKGEDQQLYIMEINPRIPAWIYLTAGVGQNIPEALTRLALGESVKPFLSYTSGKMFIRYSWDMIVDHSEFQEISIRGEL